MSFSASRRSSFVGGTPSMVAPGSEGVSCRASVRDRHPLGSWTDMSTDPEIGPRRFAVVGDGRLGNALAHALRAAGYTVDGPLGRGARCPGADAVLLCVPDYEIAAAVAAVAPGPLVGHCSGATTLEPLEPHDRFSLHPLMTVTRAGASFAGAGCAIAGSTPRALGVARALASTLGMRPV